MSCKTFTLYKSTNNALECPFIIVLVFVSAHVKLLQNNIKCMLMWTEVTLRSTHITVDLIFESSFGSKCDKVWCLPSKVKLQLLIPEGRFVHCM